MKKLLCIILCLGIMLSSANIVFAGDEISVLVNTAIHFTCDGKEYIPSDGNDLRAYPLTYNGRTYIPARFIGERMGLAVSWDEATQTVGFTSTGNVEYSICNVKDIPSPYYDNAVINEEIKFTYNGVAFVPTEADGTKINAITYRDRTYIPARFIAEKAGYAVDWDANTQTVIFNAPKTSDAHKQWIKDLYNGIYIHYDGGAEDISNRTDINNRTLPIKGIRYDAKEAIYLLLTGFTADIANKKTIEIKNGQYVANFTNYEETLPSYPEVYTYYAKNKLNHTDEQINAHIAKVMALGTDIVTPDPDFDKAQGSDSFTIGAFGQITHPSGEAIRNGKNPEASVGMDSNRLWYIYEGEQYGASGVDMSVSAHLELNELVEDYPEQLHYYAQNHTDKFSLANAVEVEVDDMLFGGVGTKRYYFRMKHVEIEIAHGPCLMMGYGEDKHWADTCKVIITGK